MVLTVKKTMDVRLGFDVTWERWYWKRLLIMVLSFSTRGGRGFLVDRGHGRSSRLEEKTEDALQTV